MSEFHIDGPEGAACQCSNCEAIWHIDDLEIAADIEQRVFAGEEVPAGQCPDEACGALCHVLTDSDGQVTMYDNIPVEGRMPRMRERWEALARENGAEPYESCGSVIGEPEWQTRGDNDGALYDTAQEWCEARGLSLSNEVHADA